jgi:hypothetical protein
LAQRRLTGKRLSPQLPGSGIDRVLGRLEIGAVQGPVLFDRLDLLPGSEQRIDIGLGWTDSCRRKLSRSAPALAPAAEISEEQDDSKPG